MTLALIPAAVLPPVTVATAIAPAEAMFTAQPAVADPPPRAEAATADAKRIAGAILEVLAGVRSITDAAVLLGVAPARYYLLEARAIAGLIAACEPRPRGPAPGAALSAEVDRLRAERDRLREEAARYQSLARIAQAAFGAPVAVPALPPASTPTGGRRADPGAPKVRKKRVATVRALRLAQQVRESQDRPASASMLTNAASTAAPPAPTLPSDHAGG
jgi:hypothetical protein